MTSLIVVDQGRVLVTNQPLKSPLNVIIQDKCTVKSSN